MKRLEQVRQTLRVKHYSYRTEQCYLRWIEQYIRFHKTPTDAAHSLFAGAAALQALQ